MKPCCSAIASSSCGLTGSAVILSLSRARNRSRCRPDPGTRRIVAVVKRWETKTTTEAGPVLAGHHHPSTANQTGATTVGFSVVEEIANPLGIVPVVDVRNSDRILDERGASEIDDLMPLTDALNKSLVDMMTTSEYVGRPSRWATGIELAEEPVLDGQGNPVLVHGEPVTTEINPIPEGSRMAVSENEQAKFGQLAAADLAGYEAAFGCCSGRSWPCQRCLGITSVFLSISPHPLMRCVPPRHR